MTRRCLPFVSLPNDTVPVTSASRPASFGERASNSSATRGRPPVMSRVFDVSCGIRASTSPTADLLAVLHRDDRAQLERDVDRQVRARELDLLALVVEQLDLRPHALRRRAGAALRIDDDERRQAGHFVDLLRDGNAFLDVLELHAAGVLGDDRTRRRIPHREHLARLTASPSFTCSVAPYGTLWRSRSRPLSSWISHFARARDDDQLALARW